MIKNFLETSKPGSFRLPFNVLIVQLSKFIWWIYTSEPSGLCVIFLFDPKVSIIDSSFHGEKSQLVFVQHNEDYYIYTTRIIIDLSFTMSDNNISLQQLKLSAQIISSSADFVKFENEIMLPSVKLNLKLHYHIRFCILHSVILHHIVISLLCKNQRG